MNGNKFRFAFRFHFVVIKLRCHLTIATSRIQKSDERKKKYKLNFQLRYYLKLLIHEFISLNVSQSVKKTCDYIRLILFMAIYVVSRAKTHLETEAFGSIGIVMEIQ